MEWYVLNHDFNGDKIEMFNIFESSRFNDCVEKLLKNFVTFKDFKERLKKDLMYCFWSKAEYEIVCSGLFDNCKEYKIDVYSQVEPNLDILARYIIDYYNSNPRRKKPIDIEA